MRKQIMGILLRHGISAAGAILAARGMLTPEQASQADVAAETFSGVCMVLAGLTLSAWQKYTATRPPTP